MFNSIVVGTDGSDTARQAVMQAIELARPLNATLHFVTVAQPLSGLRPEGELVPKEPAGGGGGRPRVEGAVAEAAEEAARAGLRHETYIRQGDPADALLDVAEERRADLIVVGNKGMTGAKRFLLGSVPNKVSHHAPCSVLIIRTT